MRDEEKFPTVRFMKCGHCGNVYTASLTGVNACPKCQAPARPEESKALPFLKENNGKHILYSVSGTVFKGRDLDALKTEIEAGLAREHESIAFSFGASTYLDSGLINLLVRTLQAQGSRGKPTYVVTKDHQVLESLQMLNLDKALVFFPTLQKYRESVAAK